MANRRGDDSRRADADAENPWSLRERVSTRAHTAVGVWPSAGPDRSRILGSKDTLKQLATIGVPEARSSRFQPFDRARSATSISQIMESTSDEAVETTER